MEKILGQEIRIHLEGNPLNNAQHAYLKGKSTETALAEAVSLIGKAINEKEVALGCFLDIGGAFDNTTYESISRAAYSKGIEPQTIKWILAMLASRNISSELGGSSVAVVANRGCPQGGVLSPLLWLLVADDLLCLLTGEGYEVTLYRSKFEYLIMDNNVDAWVRDSGIPFMNLKGMFYAHFFLLVFAMLGAWTPAAYLFYNGIFMLLLIFGMIHREKSEHLELAMIIDGSSIMLDIFCLSSFFPASAMGKFSAVMGIFNLLLRFLSFLVIRNEVTNRNGDGRLIGNSPSFGGQYQDIDGGER
ncbi:Reverse transcriptase (RNA-dependent DNA polymerase) [Nesidiocoris tenuis]|uniref:Reverse transcriptase (RNA-dependent DNA polymerase) n=1 Tax=Nesidiocoris tenuis TaxID=355587 RepID=A0ABN7AJ55_9HEMI|nr:Reverse transcriptase (RNA-dependent DNA polymerase) [Nesidiocoris tenuis]